MSFGELASTTRGIHAWIRDAQEKGDLDDIEEACKRAIEVIQPYMKQLPAKLRRIYDEISDPDVTPDPDEVAALLAKVNVLDRQPGDFIDRPGHRTEAMAAIHGEYRPGADDSLFHAARPGFTYVVWSYPSGHGTHEESVAYEVPDSQVDQKVQSIRSYGSGHVHTSKTVSRMMSVQKSA